MVVNPIWTKVHHLLLSKLFPEESTIAVQPSLAAKENMVAQEKLIAPVLAVAKGKMDALAKPIA